MRSTTKEINGAQEETIMMEQYREPCWENYHKSLRGNNIAVMNIEQRGAM